MRRLGGVARWLAIALLAASVVQELRKPARQRSWRGRAFGVVPYDLRPPTLARIKESVWNPRDEHLFVSRPFGVGWSLNLYQVQRRLRRAVGGG